MKDAWRWVQCRIGRHFWVIVDIDGGELDGEHVFCWFCGIRGVSDE